MFTNNKEVFIIHHTFTRGPLFKFDKQKTSYTGKILTNQCICPLIQELETKRKTINGVYSIRDTRSSREYDIIIHKNIFVTLNATKTSDKVLVIRTLSEFDKFNERFCQIRLFGQNKKQFGGKSIKNSKLSKKENNINKSIGYATLDWDKIMKKYGGIVFEDAFFGGEQDPYCSEDRFYTLPIKGKRYGSYLDLQGPLPGLVIWNSSIIKSANFKGISSSPFYDSDLNCGLKSLPRLKLKKEYTSKTRKNYKINTFYSYANYEYCV
jgi:hypothetical protein